MFGSEILEVAIGLILVYLLLSLICSVTNEWVARIFAMRSATLEKGVQNLLRDPQMVRNLYAHPLIKRFAQQGWFDRLLKREGKPSYIPSRTFALALIDIMPGGLAACSTEVKNLRSAIAELTAGGEEGEWKTAFLALVDAAQGDFDKVRKNIEGWFDDAMDRVSGWYKRKVQMIILILALIASGLLNADTFTIANSLWREDTVRASVVAAAQESVKQPLPSGSDTSLTRVRELQDELDQLKLPFGWVSASDKYVDPREVPGGFLGWFYKILGLLFTAFALSLGAPFWFDTLKKFVNLRGAGKEPAGK